MSLRAKGEAIQVKGISFLSGFFPAVRFAQRDAASLQFSRSSAGQAAFLCSSSLPVVGMTIYVQNDSWIASQARNDEMLMDYSSQFGSQQSQGDGCCFFRFINVLVEIQNFFTTSFAVLFSGQYSSFTSSMNFLL
ncbi:MAG: hypothetical protein PHR46_00615 [Candidatus Absconditabacteria bacterium]|nr:hypothetical protein [Candidatus Absconditabacteria bacterium]